MRVIEKNAIIENGATESNAINIEYFTFISLILPVLNSGDITFKVAGKSNGTYVTLHKIDGTIVTVNAGTGNKAIAYIEELAGYKWIKIVSATTQTEVRNIKVICKYSYKYVYKS